MKKVMSSIVFLFIAVFAFAQDSTATTSTGIDTIFNDHWKIIITGIISIIEILVRIVPTLNNWSILSNILKIVGLIFPNNNTNLGTHEKIG